MDDWGIKVIAYDPFSPQKRNRHISVPKRHGRTEMGVERYYDSREIRVDCLLTKHLTKAEFREIAYQLHYTNDIYFWDEPEKFYRCELFESVGVDVFPKEINRQFTLPFRCDIPFAMNPLQIMPLDRGYNTINYEGTAETPTIITVRNIGTTPVSHVILTRHRRITR